VMEHGTLLGRPEEENLLGMALSSAGVRHVVGQIALSSRDVLVMAVP